MHIWLSIPNFSATVGGPATVVQHLSRQLVSLGASVTVITAEATPGQPEGLPPDPRVNVFHVVRGSRSVSNAAFCGGRHKELKKTLGSKNESVVHDFGLWLPANHAVASVCRSRGISLVGSTCGMLAPWALAHKAWKKRLAWWLYQLRDLSRAAVLVATSAQEVQDIRRMVPGKKIALVPNGVELPEVRRRSEVSGHWSVVKGHGSEAGRQRTVVFLGRIHPVKGLNNLVEAWHIARPSGWRCIVAGPNEAGHQKELEALLRLHNLEDTFEFPGMMADNQKWELLREADLFVLPSFTENFGIAVAEALAAGVPAITTTGTPWEELRTRQCGWWIDIGVEPLAAALREAIELSDQERYEMGQRGRRLVEEKYSWPQIGRDMLAVYDWILGQAPQPPCVRSQ